MTTITETWISLFVNTCCKIFFPNIGRYLICGTYVRSFEHYNNIPTPFGRVEPDYLTRAEILIEKKQRQKQ